MSDIDKPSNLEDEYFAREEIEQKRKLAAQQAEKLEQKRREELKAQHFMKCPKCGMDLQAIHRGKVEIDTCFSCGGMWLDAGEMEHLLSQGPEGGGKVMKAVLGIFRKS